MNPDPRHSNATARVEDLENEVAQLRDQVEDLEQARQQAVHAAEAKAHFISHISHELRTPMNGILGMTRLALETELNTEQREYLETVQSSADALLTLVNDLLDHAKIGAGKLHLEDIPFRLEETVKETLRGVGVLADHKGITLDHHFATDIPTTVVGDPTRLRQILLNLVGNALKFTEDGGVRVVVDCPDRSSETATVRFAISDTGIGIAPDRLATIFDAFEQADVSTTRRYGGTGLGLSISVQLVGLMAGTIDVESEVGVGSTFTVTIPFGVRATTQDWTPEIPVSGGRTIPVLVVSDSPVNRDTLVEVMSEGRFEPRFTEDPAKAVAMLARAGDRPFGLVLLDLQRNGLDTAWEIRRESGATPIILLTPSGQRGDAARCRDIGVGGYITGPLVASDLQDTIAAVLAGTPDLITRYWLREHRRSLAILVADDSATNRLLASRLLEKRGHSVIGVDNGAAAVQAVDQREFDIVLMDIHMPELDGYEATRAIRALPGTRAQIPIIALTGSVNDDGKDRSLGAGMNAYLPKPFRIEELLTLIEDLTKSS